MMNKLYIKEPFSQVVHHYQKKKKRERERIIFEEHKSLTIINK